MGVNIVVHLLHWTGKLLTSISLYCSN